MPTLQDVRAVFLEGGITTCIKQYRTTYRNSEGLNQKEELMNRLQIQDLSNNSIREITQEDQELNAIRGGGWFSGLFEDNSDDYEGGENGEGFGTLRTTFTF